jgi:hypothetical protein
MAIPSSKMPGEREYLRLLRAGHAGGKVSIQVKGEKIKDAAPDTRWRSAAWRLVLDCGHPAVRVELQDVANANKRQCKVGCGYSPKITGSGQRILGPSRNRTREG